MKPRRVLNRWDMWFTDSQADWDTWEYWEQCRFEDMEARMPPKGLLFDVGAEFGSISAVYAKHILGDGRRIVLFEPSPDFWPNIRRTWDANLLMPPAGAVLALVDESGLGNATMLDEWPDCTFGRITDTMDYRSLNQDPERQIPRVSIDRYVEMSGNVPAALTIDVEGAEHLVLRGASRTLLRDRPVVWVSVHPDLMEKNYGTDAEEVFRFMHRHGYVGRFLCTDHEEHWRFDPDSMQ